MTVVVSRNHLNNRSYKYKDNDESDPNNKILDYTSQEIENKLRVENTYRNKGFKVNFGAGYENVTYTNSTFNKITTPAGVATIDFDSKLTFNKFSVFGQVSKGIFKERVILSLGARTDFSDYSTDMMNPLNQFSPRFSMAVNITDALSFNFNVGTILPVACLYGVRLSRFSKCAGEQTK
jgi:hypothetical protein